MKLYDFLKQDKLKDITIAIKFNSEYNDWAAYFVSPKCIIDSGLAITDKNKKGRVINLDGSIWTGDTPAAAVNSLFECIRGMLLIVNDEYEVEIPELELIGE